MSDLPPDSSSGSPHDRHSVPPRVSPRADEPQAADVPAHGRLTLLQSVVAVLAALFGVRSRAGFRRDLTYGNPALFVLIGFVLFCIFVVVLWILVHFLVLYLLHQQGI